MLENSLSGSEGGGALLSLPLSLALGVSLHDTTLTRGYGSAMKVGQ
jgi:hypothetical protein